MFRLIQPLGGLGIGSRSGGGAVFNPASVSGYSRDWNFADITKIYTDTAGTVLATADGDPIGAILCSAGSTIKLSAPADASRPTYETNIQNGLSVARFDGSDDYLTNATAIDADASQTLYVVLQKRAAPNSTVRTMFAYAVAASIVTDTDIGAGYVYVQNSTPAQVDVGGTATNWSIITLKYTDLSNLSVYVNGGAPTAMNPADNYATSTAFFVGANQAAANDSDIDVGRILLYSAVHTTEQMDTVLSGLGALWGISVTATS
jgi:hypothetical protein